MEEKQLHLQRKVDDLEAVIANMHKGEPGVAENSAPRSVKKRAQPKCVLIDWSGTDEIVVEGRLLSSDPQDFMNGIPLGPDSVKVSVETTIKPDAFVWRPSPNMFTIEEAVGEMIAWHANVCIVSDVSFDTEDIAPKSPSINCISKLCKLKHWSGKDEIVVAEGYWQTKEPKTIVYGLSLGPKAVKVFVDVVLQPDTFLWRLSPEMKKMEDALKSSIA